ncbi:MAG: hypothetical protein HY329_15910, partial [Chloroflexi bacterium]|nr:hypothetical protein [Chloroflexota bacterium]
MTHPTPTPIPARPDFPVTWEQPDDALMCWTLDRMHFPDPMSPLEDAFMRIMAEHGFNSAAAGYALPVRFQARRINTYHYEAIVPLRLPPEELEALGRQSEEMLGAAMARLEELWE